MEDQLSPKALLWLKRVGKKEGQSPWQILSRVIEAYMELEEKMGEEGVTRLVEVLENGPGEIVAKLEVERLKLAEFNERAQGTLSVMRLYTAQLHARRNINDRGEVAYELGGEEKETLFELDEAGEEKGERLG
jgi:hypothetical protein